MIDLHPTTSFSSRRPLSADRLDLSAALRPFTHARQAPAIYLLIQLVARLIISAKLFEGMSNLVAHRPEGHRRSEASKLDTIGNHNELRWTAPDNAWTHSGQLSG